MTASSVARVMRWIGRVWSVLVIAAVLAFAFGELMTKGGPRLTPRLLLGFVFWPIGVGVGLVVAWVA